LPQQQCEEKSKALQNPSELEAVVSSLNDDTKWKEIEVSECEFAQYEHGLISTASLNVA
jgi:hypothetical protein